MFRFMLPQRGLGEHPLSPGMPLLISAAINQFSSSHQPHRHPLHLLLLFLSTSALPHGSFSSALFRSARWFSALNRGRGRVKSSRPPPPAPPSSLDSNEAGGCFHEHLTVVQLDPKLTCAYAALEQLMNRLSVCIHVLAAAHFSCSKHMVISSTSAEACEQCVNCATYQVLQHETK